jgi:hypothetical protein
MVFADMALKELTSVLDAFATTTQKLQATPRNLNELAEAGNLPLHVHHTHARAPSVRLLPSPPSLHLCL